MTTTPTTYRESDETIPWHLAGAYAGAHEFRSFAGSNAICAETILNADGDADCCPDRADGTLHRPPYVAAFDPEATPASAS